MISNSFNEYTKLAYRLYAVFIHQGSVEFGHYYIYIYDFKKDVWRKYNDNDITEVKDTAEIFRNPNRANPPTPYFLVYVNAAMKDRLVEPVCREIPSQTTTTENTATTAIPQSDGPMDIDVDMEMKPPSYFDLKPKGESEGMSEFWSEKKIAEADLFQLVVSNVDPTSPLSPTAVPLKRKGSVDQMSITMSAPVDAS
jgi:ubiquitin carboxyl-terminal hydrolase 25/28